MPQNDIHIIKRSGIANGKIIFGGDATSISKQDCPTPISRAKLKETLIKNKIK